MRQFFLLAFTALFLAACAAKGPVAETVLQPTKGNTAAGAMTFAQQDGKVLIKGQFTGLTPGAHGFHIHEKGDCSAPDATSAGGHFNPFAKPHGDPAKPAHHAGDLPMLVAGADGQARFEALLDGITLGNGPASILGRSVIIHAQPDDFTTQPTGNSGARAACGVIKAK
jgi:superoxide dismutase, Cu-Zn family